jgi:hypothetical protein
MQKRGHPSPLTTIWKANNSILFDTPTSPSLRLEAEARAAGNRKKMEIYSSMIGIALSACALSSSTTIAFLHFLPLPGTRHSNDNQQNQKNPNLDMPTDSLPRISQLAYYPSDEPLSERLKDVEADWESVKLIREGIKYFTDELNAAEKIAKVNAESAEKGAADVIEQGESDDYLLKPFVEGMGETGKILAKEMMEVRQEFDELKASKIVEESTEDVIRVAVLVEKGERTTHI